MLIVLQKCERLPLIGVMLRARRARIVAVERDATVLILERGAIAYSQARARARVAARHDVRIHWSQVAVAIAQRQGITIGRTTADSYHEEARTWVPPEG